MLNKVLQAGQVNIVACDILQANGEGLNVVALIEKVSIYEDLFSPFVSGELVLRDTYDIPNTLGRSTRDLLRLEINTPGNDKQKDISGFYLIYKISNRQLASDRSQIYTIHFCSEEMIYDAQRKVSKAFSGAGETIVKNMLDTRLGSTKKFDFDATSNKLKYVSNFWAPTQNIRYVVENSLDKDSNPGFVFYENRSGFHFKSLPILANGESVQKFVANDFVANVETSNTDSVKFGSASRNPIMDYSIIREFRVDSTFDYLDFLTKGAANTILYTHDLTTKKIKMNRFTLKDDSHNRLNPNRFLTDDTIKYTEPSIMTLSKNTSGGDYTNARFLQKRISQIAQYQSFKVEIDVFGRTDYEVGQKVYVDVNQVRPISKDEDSDSILDKVYSGNYLISKVAHHITRIEHKTTLELIKDSTILK